MPIIFYLIHLIDSYLHNIEEKYSKIRALRIRFMSKIHLKKN